MAQVIPVEWSIANKSGKDLTVHVKYGASDRYGYAVLPLDEKLHRASNPEIFTLPANSVFRFPLSKIEWPIAVFVWRGQTAVVPKIMPKGPPAHSGFWYLQSSALYAQAGYSMNKLVTEFPDGIDLVWVSGGKANVKSFRIVKRAAHPVDEAKMMIVQGEPMVRMPSVLPLVSGGARRQRGTTTRKRSGSRSRSRSTSRKPVPYRGSTRRLVRALIHKLPKKTRNAKRASKNSSDCVRAKRTAKGYTCPHGRTLGPGNCCVTTMNAVLPLHGSHATDLGPPKSPDAHRLATIQHEEAKALTAAQKQMFIGSHDADGMQETVRAFLAAVSENPEATQQMINVVNQADSKVAESKGWGQWFRNKATQLGNGVVYVLGKGRNVLQWLWNNPVVLFIVSTILIWIRRAYCAYMHRKGYSTSVTQLHIPYLAEFLAALGAGTAWTASLVTTLAPLGWLGTVLAPVLVPIIMGVLSRQVTSMIASHFDTKQVARAGTIAAWIWALAQQCSGSFTAAELSVADGLIGPVQLTADQQKQVIDQQWIQSRPVNPASAWQPRPLMSDSERYTAAPVIHTNYTPSQPQVGAIVEPAVAQKSVASAYAAAALIPPVLTNLGRPQVAPTQHNNDLQRFVAEQQRRAQELEQARLQQQFRGQMAIEGSAKQQSAATASLSLPSNVGHLAIGDGRSNTSVQPVDFTTEQLHYVSRQLRRANAYLTPEAAAHKYSAVALRDAIDAGDYDIYRLVSGLLAVRS